MPQTLDLIFFGTPDFSVPTLRALADAGHRAHLVCTRPDKPAGRGGKMRPPPVKVAAEELGITVEQPRSLKGGIGAHLRERIASLRPDVAVVVAYGRIVPEALLEVPRLGFVNVHASLLPRWRGASPIQAAIRAGDRETGVTIMKMDPGLDTGPMLLRRAVPLPEQATAGEMHDTLAPLGAELLVEALAGLADGSLKEVPQPDDGVTYAPMLKKKDGVLDWSLPAAGIRDHVRAMTPWPGAQTRLLGADVRLSEVSLPDEAPPPGAAPGTLVAVDGEAGLVATGDGLVRVATIQPAGKRAMTVSSFLQGRRTAPPCLFEP